MNAKRRCMGSEIKILRRYYPDYGILKKILHRDRRAIRNKAHRLGISGGDVPGKALPETMACANRKKIILPGSDAPSVVIKKSSYLSTIKEVEDEIYTALVLLRESKNLSEWTTRLDAYNALTVKRAQIEQNKRYYKP